MFWISHYTQRHTYTDSVKCCVCVCLWVVYASMWVVVLEGLIFELSAHVSDYPPRAH